MERLHKVMAQAGVASRRRSEELILKGFVKVDGQTVRELGVKVDPDTSIIEVMGRRISWREPRSYLMLNKPQGYLTSVVDPFGRPTVMELVADGPTGLFPVGRLDRESEGLLVMTNDGELAYRLTHPSFKVPKTYAVTVRGRPAAEAIWRLRNGVELEEGRTRPALVRVVERRGHSTRLEITISEGRKRQVRRMCQAVGHAVISLRRVAIGPLTLGDLRPGESRPLFVAELAKIKQAVDLP